MTSRKVRFWVAILLFLFSVALLALSALPVPRERQSVPLPVITLPAPELTPTSQAFVIPYPGKAGLACTLS